MFLLFKGFVVKSLARLVVLKAAGGFVEDDIPFSLAIRRRRVEFILCRRLAVIILLSNHFGQPFVGGLVDVLVGVFVHVDIVLVLVGGGGVEPPAIIQVQVTAACI